MSKVVVGWTDTYGNNLKSVPLGEERKRALVERIRKRRYSFGYNDYEYLPYCCPVFDDGTTCMLTKDQFNKVMDEAWKDMHIGRRWLPMDAISGQPKNGVLYEKQKFEPKEND